MLSRRWSMNRYLPFYFCTITLFLILDLFVPSYSLSQAPVRKSAYPAMEAQGDDFVATAVQIETSHAKVVRGNPSQVSGVKPHATPPGIGSPFVVTTTADTGSGSLRWAINSSNTSAGLDVINFDISPGGPQTITPHSPFPQFNDPVIIDGTTQPGFSGSPIIEIDGSLAGAGVNGLSLVGGNSIVRGLVINRFQRFATGGNGYAIMLDVNGGNFIEGNYIGTSIDGTIALPNGSGIGMFSTSGGNVIGGTTPEMRNVISGNISTGIAIASGSIGGNIVRGNYIGTNADGTAPLGNGGNGIFVNAPDDSIGGLDPGARNIISGGINLFPALFIGAFANRTVVQGNYIGTDLTGSVNLGNISNGINIRSSSNIIGDVSSSGRNVVVGSGAAGIYVFGQTAAGNRIINNYIGTDITGSVAFPNTVGIVLDGAPKNSIGGKAPEEGNVISGNLLDAINLINSASGNSILNNLIGTDATGQLSLGSQGLFAIAINGSEDTVEFNTIAYNNGIGVYIENGIENRITRNSIYSNTGLGIDIAPLGITINDPLDFDAGSNNLQNFPLLDSSRVAGDQIIVHGRINSTPNSEVRLDFYTNSDYDPSHFGEGQSWSLATLRSTDSYGNGTFSISLPIVIGAPPKYITATATDTRGSTSEFSQALCTLDTDGDGILDSWETAGWGIDINSDTTIDLDLNKLGAHPDHKDIFVEIDAMTGMAPQPGTLDSVVDAFDRAPAALINNPDGKPGIKLHCLPLDETTLPLTPWLPPIDRWEAFNQAKLSHFGSVANRADPDSLFILEARKLVYRYCIFAFSTNGSSGVTENEPDHLGGNDIMVTLGFWSPPGGTEMEKAATFMHELGHSLGLQHGGDDGVNYKPNYVSIMNYAWQFKYDWNPSFWWGLNYSTTALPALNENSLDENVGLNPQPGTIKTMTVPFSGPDRQIHYAFLVPNMPVDWDTNGSFTTVQQDLNGYNLQYPPDGKHTLTSQSDWDKLKYNFRNSSHSVDLRRTRLSGGEVEEMDTSTYNFLKNLPPPKPSGLFIMDGQLDTSAQLIATNAGINLYARYQSGQLYVASNSAQSQGADICIIISDASNPLRAAPLEKTGQVPAWTTYLGNRSIDRSSQWYTAIETPLDDISVDSAGDVLEGVINLQLLYGKDPANLFIAVGTYETDSSGALLAQVPSGNGDGDIEFQEFFWFLGAPPLPSLFTQQGDKLVGTGAIGSAWQGSAVSISSDGNTALVGGSGDKNYAGAAWVFTRTGGVWDPQGTKLVCTGAVGSAQIGNSVSLSGDGNTALVGGPNDSSGAGAVWTFIRNNGTWTQLGSKMAGTLTDVFSLGYSVSISSDGNTALVGGQVYTHGLATEPVALPFVRTTEGWIQQGDSLEGTDALPGGTGVAVALSADGNTAILGAKEDNLATGASWIFVRSGGVWSQQGNKLVGIPAYHAHRQGSTVSLSADGNTALIGKSVSGIGGAWVFTRSGGTWSQQGNELAATGTVGSSGNQLGSSVSLSGDGNRALVGGKADNNYVGAVWVFRRNNGVWTQEGEKVVGTGGVGISSQGFSVSLSSDGNTALVGGLSDSSNAGAAWVFTRGDAQPTSMSDLSATALGEASVRLDWTTISESNNYGFEIERSFDNTNNFITLSNSFVPGNGTSPDPHSYFYVDTTVGLGDWTYRLKLIEVGGTVRYSDSVHVLVVTGVDESTLPKEFALYQNYPNPFNPSTIIRYDVPYTAQVTLRVYNVLGQEVATLVNGEKLAGAYQVRLNAKGNMASGIYYYRLESGSFVQTKKLVLVK
jgi:hypothetical protein